MHGPEGAEVALYEPGDFVRLCRDEDGAVVTARAGDWGRVAKVHPDGSLDISFAGHSRARDASLVRAVAVRRSHVQPCDDQGHPRQPLRGPVWDTRRAR